jgi:hypothetical protein
MKWDENGIAVCMYHSLFPSYVRHRMITSGSFYRAAVPLDVVAGAPNPSTWGPPVAQLSPDGCDIESNFVNHSIIFGTS